jgi:membrane protein DedA with SNARE-associated domain
MFEWLDQLFAVAMDAVNQGNAAAMATLFFIVALTEIGIPFPFILDSVLFFTSYSAGPLSVQVMLVFLMVFLGRQFGSTVVYWLTRLLGNALINWLGKRFPKVSGNLERLENNLSTHAVMAVTIPRLTGLLTLVSIASGAIRLRYYYFVLGVALSSFIFDGALIVLGYITKQGFEYLGFTPSAWHVIVALVIVISLVWVVTHVLIKKISR